MSLTATSLSIPFSGRDVGRSENWLNLEQVQVAEVVRSADLSDLLQMFAMVRSGLSARNYKKADCPVLVTGKDSATITLDFYVWPSSMALPYSLTAAGGVVSGPERIEMARSFDLVVPLTDRVDLGLLFSGTVELQTRCYNELSEVVPTPDMVIDNGVLSLSAHVFAVLRLTGVAYGYKHSVTIAIDGVDDSRINNLHESIIASWLDGDGQPATTTLDMEIPACVADTLAACPGDESWSVSVNVTDTPEPTPKVYFSTCTGKVIELRYE